MRLLSEPEGKNQICAQYSGQEFSKPLQGSAKERSLGCVIPGSWLPLAAGARFTQPRDHSLANHCAVYKADLGRYVRKTT